MAATPRPYNLEVAEQPQYVLSDTKPSLHLDLDNLKQIADERQVLLAITVEIEEGHFELISVREGDSAEEIAANFCKEHGISDHYVSPLTEHIINKLQDTTSLDENTGLPETEARAHTDSASEEISQFSSRRRSTNYYLYRKNQPKLCEHKLCSLKSLLEMELPKVKTRKPTGRHILPSFTSIAKSQKVEPVFETIPEFQRSGQLSPKLEAVYTRLYVEFLRHRQRMEEEKKMCQEQYRERLEREKPVYTKRTRRIMLMRERAAKHFRNYGELLYWEALNKDAERKRLAEQKALEDHMHELEGFTAKPNISKYAKQLKRPGQNFWERLSSVDNSRLHIRELQHESLETKLMECTFRPRINRHILGEQDASENGNRFDQLFWDAENRRRRQAEYTQWYPEGVTFRPLINRHWQSGNIYGHDGLLSHKRNVFTRLLQYAEKLREKKKRWQDNELRPVDPTTGQELFRPQIGRKPYAERNTDAIPIGNFLYQLKFALDNKRCTLEDQSIKKARDLANCQYVSAKSSKLLQNIKTRSLQEIFDHLDTDKDGYIDLSTADTRLLSNEVVEDISDLRDLNNERRLSYDKFSALMMSIQKKKKRGVHLVLNACRKHLDVEKYSFKFKIDKQSHRLSSGRRKPGNSWHWYRLLLTERESRQAKIEALRKEKENQELAECTFRPSLHKNDCKGRTRFVREGPNSKHLYPQSTVMEKEQQEIHGFIFQEVDMEGSVHAGTAATGEVPSPSSLLKSLRKIVSRSSSER